MRIASVVLVGILLSTQPATNAGASSIEPPAPGEKKADGDKGERAKGERNGEGRRERSDRAGGDANGRAGAIGDPAAMVARVMARFDKDGDSKLDANELQEFLVEMRSRMAGGDRGAMARRRGGDEAEGDGQQRKRGQSRKRPTRGGETDPGERGGDTPKRPAANDDK